MNESANAIGTSKGSKKRWVWIMICPRPPAHHTHTHTHHGPSHSPVGVLLRNEEEGVMGGVTGGVRLPLLWRGGVDTFPRDTELDKVSESFGWIFFFRDSCSRRAASVMNLQQQWKGPFMSNQDHIQSRIMTVNSSLDRCSTLGKGLIHRSVPISKNHNHCPFPTWWNYLLAPCFKVPQSQDPFFPGQTLCAGNGST